MAYSLLKEFTKIDVISILVYVLLQLFQFHKIEHEIRNSHDTDALLYLSMSMVVLSNINVLKDIGRHVVSG